MGSWRDLSREMMEPHGKPRPGDGPFLKWLISRRRWQAGLLGAAIGAPTVILLSETVRWFRGLGFFR